MDDFNEVLAERAKELYYKCDLEHKGHITRKDMNRLAALLPLNLDQLEHVFDRLDDDGNGHLTLEEFTGGFGGFITGEFPTHKGDEEKKSTDLIVESQAEETNFDVTINQLENAGIFEDTVSIDSMVEMYERLRKTNKDMLPGFEGILHKCSKLIYQSHTDVEKIESSMNMKTNEYEIEIRKLYDDMETHIRAEEEKLLAEEKIKEKLLRDELGKELHEKEKQYQEIFQQHDQMLHRIEELKSQRELTEQDNNGIHQVKEKMEEQLDEAFLNLTYTKTRIDEMQSKVKEDRKQRVSAVSSVSHGLVQEKDSLLSKLTNLRELNKKLRDEQDEGLTNNNPANSLASEIMSFGEACENRPGGGTTMLEDEEGGGGGGGGPGVPQVAGEPEPQGEVLGEALGDYFISGNISSQSEESEPEEVGESIIVAGAAVYTAATVTTAASTSNRRQKKKKKRIKTVQVMVPRPPKVLPETSTSSIQAEQFEYSERTEVEIQTEPEPEPEPEPIPEPEAMPEPQIEPDIIPIATDTVDSAHSLQLGTEEKDEVAVTYEPVFSGEELPNCVFKVVFLGDTGVGKTSILNRFCNNSFRKNHHQTIGIDFQIKSVTVNDNRIALQTWDTAGQERFQSITKQYYRKADGVVLVYDITKEGSFINIRRWAESVEENMESGQEVVLMMLGNKKDFCEEGGPPAAIPSNSGRDMAETYGALFFEVSAKTGENVNKAFEAMAKIMKRKEDNELKNAVRVSADIEKKKGCCGGSKSNETNKKTN